jgi:hypothetical protein
MDAYDDGAREHGKSGLHLAARGVELPRLP